MPTDLRRRAAELYYRYRSRPPLLARTRPSAAPDFVGIGAQRSGTSWWHSLIESHPDVHALGWPYKELHFFDRFASGEFGDREVRAYREWFRRPPGRLAGEWTPRYMFDTWTPSLLRRAAPDARLLVMLRDPVARFRSAYEHALSRGGVAPSAARLEAIQRGMYHKQLANVLVAYPREQLLVLQFEQCVAEPAHMLERTFVFLGLDPFVPQHVARPVNTSRQPTPPLHPDDLAQLRDAYGPDIAALLRAFPEIDPRLWHEADAS